MIEENGVLVKNKTWALVPLPPNKKSMECRWVFKLKMNPNGLTNKYKAQLVAKGYL